MRDAQPKTIYLQDYQAPAFRVSETALYFDLNDDYTRVRSELKIERNEAALDDAPLELNGAELELETIRLDQQVLSESDYQLDGEVLRIAGVPASFVLECETRIDPANNTSLEGLYRSRDLYCTQCEAEGFRKITFFPDRPDVMSVYTVSIEADSDRFPVLLSNGNLVEKKKLGKGRHLAVWHDPFPKPSYLFALVAGDLVSLDDTFVTASGRKVNLHIHVEAKDLDKCDFAMGALKRSMAWDEEVFGREYDLDIFNIVAVDDFNMGAMENKSLNIFNSSCVLASPAITTDLGFQRIEAIVAHEYFHNWSGNRVTCRDWFQLSLKEGFTVFRDALFTADMASPTVKRVDDVALLRTAQFAEDAGPLAHPVQPASFIEISNFYTVTVYEKGAEVVRMIYTLLGPEQFRAGSDLYFDRHDGQAVTCEEFVKAMEDASGVDLSQFRRWYSQAGTPRVAVTGCYDETTETYTLEVKQSCPPTPGQPEKQPFAIPFGVGLLGDAGNLPLALAGEQLDPEQSDNTHRVLLLTEEKQQYFFTGVKECPVPSLLRDFSAPVRLDFDYSETDLRALMSRDGDGFVRWDAAQQLATRTIQSVQAQIQAGDQIKVMPLLGEACGDLLANTALDPHMVSLMLLPPTENYLAELCEGPASLDVVSLHQAREQVLTSVAAATADITGQRYHELTCTEPYQSTGAQVGNRALRNALLQLLVVHSADNLSLAQAQFEQADNMTDRLAALRCLVHYDDGSFAEGALDQFYQQWQHETLVINQWLTIQATRPVAATVETVLKLMEHPDFELKNPNRVRALIGAFASANAVAFHREDGAGYRLLADSVIALDAMNPQIAARLLTPLSRWQKMARGAQQMREQLERIAAIDELSKDSFEVVNKSLAG